MTSIAFPAWGVRQSVGPEPAPLASSARRSRPRPSATVRLTRRGRALRALLSVVFLPCLVLLALVAGAGIIGSAVGGEGHAAPGAGVGVPVSARTLVVVRGDTLWSIARSLDEDGDPRVLVDEISAANGLRGGVIVPGQRLVLPATGSAG